MSDTGILNSYRPAKKAFRIYNRRTQKIRETIHVTYDELTTLASEKFSSGPGLQLMTPTTSSSGLILKPIPQQHFNLPKRDNWDRLFQHMFDEYFNPPTIDVSPVPVVVAPRAVYIANSSVSMSINQDAPPTNNYNRDLIIRRREERSLNNNSFLGEYECSSLALDREERREEKIRSLETRSKNVNGQEI
nr:hypothetical protein [Tanacetum cinerariifolium]